MIAAIGAVSGNGMIGLEGWLPWDIPEELAYFERTVAGSALLIGRLTYESMDVVPPDSFVVTSRTGMKLKPGCRAVDSVEHGLSAALATGKNVFVIGGAALYETAWPYCHFFYLTRIERAFHGARVCLTAFLLSAGRSLVKVAKRTLNASPASRSYAAFYGIVKITLSRCRFWIAKIFMCEQNQPI